MNTSTRRDFLKTTGIGALTLASLTPAALAATNKNSKLRVLSIGVTGTIGAADRRQISSHPTAEISGLCDVDSKVLEKAAQQHPDAFTCADYREAFEKHEDKFDAVIVATPDHTHAAIILTAMAHLKHIYGQKPLVQQLDELEMIQQGLKARPNLITQLGNQRMAGAGRRAFVDIMKAGMLGKAIEGYAFASSPAKGQYFNYDNLLEPPSKPPEHLDWNLWLGPTQKVDYRAGMCPRVWRSWWDYGGNGLGDWGCHLLDVLFFSFDELQSPSKVLTHGPKVTSEHFHTTGCKSTLTYPVDSENFLNKTFRIHFWDNNQKPAREELGLPPGKWPGEHLSIIVCEGGTMVLSASGRLEVWRDGKMEAGIRLPGLPKYERMNYWHAWVDSCLGRDTLLQTPFPDALRITESTILPVKAARFPGEELEWDRSTLTFTNHKKATDTVVGREWRKEFLPPDFG